MSRTCLVVLYAALFAATSGCYASTRVDRSRLRPVVDRRPARLSVVLTDGRQLTVQRPRLQGDSLLGDTLVLRNLDRVVSFPIAIPLAEIRSAYTSEFSIGLTILTVLLLPVALLAFVGAAYGFPSFSVL